jgi:hypothetical protein
MKTALKWILGILIGLVLLAVVVAAGYFIFTQWNVAGVMMRPRVALPFEGRRGVPLEPFRMMPYQRFGGFFPLRLIGSGLFCLGFLALIVLGAVALVRVLRQPRVAAVTPAPAAAPIQMPEAAQNPVATRNCSNCGKPVQEDWSHCPYCGNTLAAS